MIIESGGKVDLRTGNQLHVLHLAAKTGFLGFYLEIIDMLCIDDQVRDSEGLTPLHLAILENQFDFACAIIPICSSFNTQDYKGKSPLHLAVIKEKKKIVKMLKIRGADQGLKDIDGENPVQLAGSNQGIRRILVGFI